MQLNRECSSTQMSGRGDQEGWGAQVLVVLVGGQAPAGRGLGHGGLGSEGGPYGLGREKCN